jgi:hypothetical protein
LCEKTAKENTLQESLAYEQTDDNLKAHLQSSPAFVDTDRTYRKNANEDLVDLSIGSAIKPYQARSTHVIKPYQPSLMSMPLRNGVYKFPKPK